MGYIYMDKVYNYTFFIVNIVMSIVHSYSPMDKGQPQLDRSHC